MQIHVVQNGEQVGPYSAEQFADLLQKGLLDDDDLYWHEGCNEWLSVAQHSAFPQRPIVVLPPPVPLSATTRHRPLVPVHPQKVCRDCGHAVSPSAPACPNCGKRLKMGCGGIIGIALACFVVVGVILLVGGTLLLSNTSREGHASMGSTKRQTTPIPAPAAKPLEAAGKLGALLLQLTPGFAPRAADLTALEPLLQQLKGSGKGSRRVVLELRHHDWLNERYREQTVAFLREQDVTLASIDGPPADAKHFTIMPAVDEITDGRLAYLRLHGRDAKAYLTGKTVAERFHYDYSDAEIAEVSERALGLAEQADEVHVVFNNNSRDFAPVAAERLRRKLGQGSKLPDRPRKQASLF